MSPWGVRQFPTQGGAGNYLVGSQGAAGKTTSNVAMPMVWFGFRPPTVNPFFNQWWPSDLFELLAPTSTTELEWANSEDAGSPRLIVVGTYAIHPPSVQPSWFFHIRSENPDSVVGDGEPLISTFFTDTGNFRVLMTSPPGQDPPDESELCGFNPIYVGAS